jgi:hypothetical protein
MLIKIKELCERLFPNIVPGEAYNKPQLQTREHTGDSATEHRSTNSNRQESTKETK